AINRQAHTRRRARLPDRLRRRAVATVHETAAQAAVHRAVRNAASSSATAYLPGPPGPRGTGRLLIGDGRGHGVGVPEAGGAGLAGVGRDRLFAGVDLGPEGVHRRARGGVAGVGPDHVGLPWSVDDADVVADELLLQVVVAEAVWVG